MNNHATERETQPLLVSLSNEFFGDLYKAPQSLHRQVQTTFIGHASYMMDLDKQLIRIMRAQAGQSPLKNMNSNNHTRQEYCCTLKYIHIHIGTYTYTLIYIYTLIHLHIHNIHTYIYVPNKIRHIKYVSNINSKRHLENLFYSSPEPQRPIDLKLGRKHRGDS